MSIYGYLGAYDDLGQWESKNSNPVYRGSLEQNLGALGLKDIGAWAATSIIYRGSAKQIGGALGLKDTAYAWMDINGYYWTMAYTFSGKSTVGNPIIGQLYPTGYLQ